MNSFNFKSQIATSREQSERLLALGLKKETADMIYVEVHCTDGSIEWDASPIMEGLTALDFEDNWPPAWSLHRLIEMMPRCLAEDKIYHESWDLNVTPCAVIYRNQDELNECIGECLGQGMYNNIIDCIEWLIKKGYFNKDYLC